MKKVKKKWGSELWIVNEPEYCGKLLTVKPGHRCSMHFHKNKKETFFILNGTLALTVIDLSDASSKDLMLHAGESITLNPLTPHSFTAFGDTDCQVIEFSTHHEDSDSYRITRSE
jgi:mannose-6-phosphate isomerase-like protein (cupin superfamily)